MKRFKGMAEHEQKTQTTLKTIENKNGNSRLTINSHGARVEELILGGQKIFTKVIRGDGKEGSSHPCIPQFGPDTSNKYNLPQHGSARNKDFESSIEDEKVVLSLNIEDGNYPEGLNIKQEQSLTNEGYSLVTKISNNNDKEDLPVDFAEHFYWNAPNGWEGLKINGVDVTDIVKNDASIELKQENIIEIPGQKPIILKQKGFSIFQLWAYKNPETGEYDKNYVCIEPAEGDPAQNFFGSPKSMISPHESRITEIAVTV